MANESIPTADPESSAGLNPSDPVDARLLDMKAAFERRPDRAEIEQRIQRENFIAPGSQTENSAPPNKDDLRNAQLKANYESGKTQEAPPADSGAPMDFNVARDTFGKVLGVVPGTPEFDGAINNFQAWYDDVSTDPKFDQVVREAERLFGTEEVLRIAHRMAGEHARSRR